MKKEKPQEQSDPFSLLLERMLLDPNVPADKLQVMLDSQESNLDRNAKIAFSVSMGKVQAQLSVVPEDKINDQTHSAYSSYKMLISYVKPFYIEAGFALTFYEEDSTKKGEIRVCVDVMHKAGHTKTYHTDVPLDDSGIKGTINKTRPHAKGSSISYGRSYLIKMVFNLSTGEADDNNGNGTAGPLGTSDDKQIKKIKDLREKLSMSEEDFKKRLKKRFDTDCPRNLTYTEAEDLIRALSLLKGKA